MLKHLKYNNTFVNKLRTNCEFVHAHNFNNVLNDKKIIDYIHYIKDNFKYNNTSPHKTINLSIEEQKKFVIDFYSQLDINLGKRINDILNNFDPNYNTIISTEKGKSFVEGNESGISNFVVNLDGTLEGLWILAHECSHAISSRQTVGDELVREFIESHTKESEDKMNDYLSRRSRWSIDSISEIESYIIEELFMDYLLRKGIASQADIENRRYDHFNSLINEAVLISEENDILSNLNDPITFKNFHDFLSKIKGKPYEKNLLNRCEYMANRDKKDNKYSQYMFRYIIGRIISYQWIEKYKTSDKNTRQSMIKEYIIYLSNTHKTDIFHTCKELLNDDFYNILEDYIYNVTDSRDLST